MLNFGDTVRIKTQEEFKKIKGYYEHSDGRFEIFGLISLSMNKYCGMTGRVIDTDYSGYSVKLDINDKWWPIKIIIDISQIRREKILEVLNV